jgi:hypothetical protein
LNQVEILENAKLKADLYKRVFGTDEGKLVLQDILDHGHVTKPASHTPDRVMFNVGRQELALYIANQIGVDFNAVIDRLRVMSQKSSTNKESYRHV